MHHEIPILPKMHMLVFGGFGGRHGGREFGGGMEGERTDLTLQRVCTVLLRLVVGGAVMKDFFFLGYIFLQCLIFFF